MVSKGMIARTHRTGRMENTSASLPVIGAMTPPSPKANPIIRLETIDLPRGANSCAIATPRGKVAIARNPATNAVKYTQMPGIYNSNIRLGVVSPWEK